MQSKGDFVYLLSFVIIFGLFIVLMLGLYKLGDLPGRIASSRNHPHAAAISFLGWLGLVVIVLWPIGLAWAFITPIRRRRRSRALSVKNVAALEESIREASEQVAAIKSTLANLASSKKTA
jgi:ABC-type multidrug transport system fused ATPase/permease subunit